MDGFEARELIRDIEIERKALTEAKERIGVFRKAVASLGIKETPGGDFDIDWDTFLNAIGEEQRHELGTILVGMLNGRSEKTGA